MSAASIGSFSVFWKLVNWNLLWSASGTADGFLLYEQKLVLFQNQNEIREFAGQQGIILEPEITVYDFTNIINTINDTERSEHCHMLLASWNFFSDFAKALNEEFIGDSEEELILDIYDKLFYGSNLKELKTEEAYHPTFNNEEREKCVYIFRSGLSLLEKQQSE